MKQEPGYKIAHRVRSTDNDRFIFSWICCFFLHLNKCYVGHIDNDRPIQQAQILWEMCTI